MIQISYPGSNMWHDQGNESDVGNTDFELQAKRGDKFLCFTLFLNVKNCSYLCNHMSDWDGVGIKMYYFKWTSDLYWKIKIEYCRQVTHSPWSCHIYGVTRCSNFMVHKRWWGCNLERKEPWWEIMGLLIIANNVHIFKTIYMYKFLVESFLFITFSTKIKLG